MVDQSPSLGRSTSNFNLFYFTWFWLTKILTGQEFGFQTSLLDILPKLNTFDLSLASYFLGRFFLCFGPKINSLFQINYWSLDSSQSKTKKLPRNWILEGVCFLAQIDLMLRSFFQRPRRCRPLAKSHIFFSFFFSFRGPLLDWFGQIMLYSHWSTQTRRSTMHVYQPLTKLWCVHLLNPAMQGLTERCRTQIF